jgi:methylated-DNA-protein-cysteine methyltransferase-like protein
MTPYQQAVLRVVRLIPAGNVASYGQIAAYVGTPRAAREVGWTMRSLGSQPDFPWWRVLNNAGKITIKGSLQNAGQLQKELLESEGVVINNLYELDMPTYRWRPDVDTLASLKLAPEYIETLLEKFELN